MNVLATHHEIGQTICPKRTQSKFDIRKRFTVTLELWKLKIQFEFTVSIVESYRKRQNFCEVFNILFADIKDHCHVRCSVVYQFENYFADALFVFTFAPQSSLHHLSRKAEGMAL